MGAGAPDPDLVRGWLSARSAARGLPQPVPVSDGWRVDTRSPLERRRYVFARPSRGLERLARRISCPHVPLKLFGSPEDLARLLPARWRVVSVGWLMTYEGTCEPHAVPDGYELQISTIGRVSSARILTREGEPAASGFAAEFAGVFVYDRIVTEMAHRRRGLGRALMAALGGERRSAASQPVLAATDEGRALYEALGWAVRSPLATALVIAD